MCGICGIYGKPDEYQIMHMCKELEHRGKDSVGVYNDQHISLGHCRLSIIDLSDAGKQPMANEDGTIQLVVNGEIYNYKELRQILESKGHVFSSNSDSEVIIHAYEDSGVSFLLKLRGMFSLALYDKKENKVILARDPMGKKPLYFYYDGSRLVFASEIKALFKSGIESYVNYDMIPNYLMYQYTMGTDTLFKNVCKVLPGTAIIFSDKGEHIWKYWDIKEYSYPCKYSLVLPEMLSDSEKTFPIRKLRELLEESVKLRLQSDVPVGVFLSGGIDSSAITALYSKFSNNLIHSFTVSFDTNSEAKYAKKVVDYLNMQDYQRQIKYHEVRITSDMVLNNIEKITWHHDEPLGDAAIINNYYLSQEASKYVKVVLAGEGGDEVFGGYPWYKYVPYISVMNKIPSWAKSSGSWLLDRVIYDTTDRLHYLKRILQFPLQKTLDDMQLYPTTVMSESDVYWLTGMKQQYKSAVLPFDIEQPLNQMLAMDCKNLLQKFLMKADKATMANTIEERLPLLDKEIVQFAFSIPTKFKKDKYILRKSVEDLLPKEIVWRKKQGFGTPVGDWLNAPKFKEYVLDRISNGKLLKEICIKESLCKVVDVYKRGDYKQQKYMALGFTNVVWSLLALQVWNDAYFGGEK